MSVYLRMSSWRQLPSMVRAYMYLFTTGWKMFIRRQSAQLWSQKWGINELANEPTDAEWARSEELSKWIAVAARTPLPWARCLQRSLALSTWMDAEGLSPVLRIGVRKSSSGIDAHSWVEFGGKVVNDYEFVADSFTAFELSDQQPTGRVSDLKHDES